MLDRRLSLWENGKFLELIAEAENCNRKLPKSYGNISDEQACKTFSRLVMSGKIREVCRFSQNVAQKELFCLLMKMLEMGKLYWIF